MRRAHEQMEAGEIVFVDSSASCDQNNSCVTFLFGSTKIGGIPLGCVIHQLQTEDDYFAAFSQIKSALGNQAFGGEGQPKIFMTDDSLAERKALKSVFPQSKLLLCLFHVLQAMWRWLWDSKHGINPQHRSHLMTLFRRVAYAPDIESFTEVEKELIITDSISNLYDNFLKHCTLLLKRKYEWCICYRTNMITRGHNTNNIVESSIRIFKDIVLERCKAFNAAALVDFISSVLEDYHKRRLLKYAGSRVAKPELNFQKFCFQSKGLNVDKVNDNLYYVNSSKDANIMYSVHTDIESCDCLAGQGGKFYKHLCAVYLKDNLIKMRYLPSLSFTNRVEFAKLAIGHVDEDFFKDMKIVNTELEISVTEGFKQPMTQTTENNTDLTDIEELNNIPKPHDININDMTTDLNTEFKRICTLAASTNSHYALKTLHNFKIKLSKINTSGEALYFFQNNKIKGRKINVQPTAISRRKLGITSGSKRVQSGRPAASNNRGPPKKKRKLA